MIKRFASFVSENAKFILIVALLLVIPSVFGIASAKINYNILSYLPEELDSVKGEVILDRVFGNAGSSFLIVENMKSKDVADLKNKIKSVNGVKNVVWIDDFADISVPYEIFPDAVKNIFYSSDGKSTLLLVQFSGLGASEETMNAIEDIKKITGGQAFISGMSVLMSDTKNVVESEAFIYISVAVAIAFIILSLTLGSVVLPLLIIISIGLAVVYNMGTNFIGEISYITQSIAAMLQIGVTMDYSVFLSDRYSEELKISNNKKEAMKNAICQTFFSVSGSAMTTVSGFVALCFMSLSLGSDIGFVMIKGVLFGILTSLVILPSLLMNFYNINPKRNRNLIPNPGIISLFCLRHKRSFAVLFAVLLIGSYIIKNNVTVYYDFIKALPKNMTSVVSLEKLKSNFGMTSTYFALCSDKTESYDVVKMSDEISDVEGIVSVLSLNSVVGPSIPDDMIPDTISDICRKDGYELMMISSATESSTEKSNIQTEQIKSILKKYDTNAILTGEAALSKDLVDITQKDFRVTGIISIAAVFIVLIFLFKSAIIPAVIISAVELAVFINEGIPFFTGEDVPFIAPTFIGCIQLGATVDYAILMTSRFLEERKKGKSSLKAIEYAVAHSYRSILQSAFVLFGATFGVYCVCNVMLVKSICLMLARGALISAAVIIFFLPLLLFVSEPLIKNNKVKIIG